VQFWRSEQLSATAASAHGQKAASGGKQWLAAMDTDHDGAVSKEEFNAYMDAQFAKADHDGTLDAQGLEQLRKTWRARPNPEPAKALILRSTVGSGAMSSTDLRKSIRVRLVRSL
jgi:hypothetical protein